MQSLDLRTSECVAHVRDLKALLNSSGSAIVDGGCSYWSALDGRESTGIDCRRLSRLFSCQACKGPHDNELEDPC